MLHRLLRAALVLALLAPGVSFPQVVGYSLLSNAAATGPAVSWPGGDGELICSGTISGATLTLQVLSPDGSTYVPLSSATTTTSLPLIADFQSGVHSMRMLVASGSPSALYCTAYVVLPAQPGVHL